MLTEPSDLISNWVPEASGVIRTGSCETRCVGGSLRLAKVHDGVNAMAVPRMRSPFGLAAGLGSAKAGVEQWWRERLSAIALVPLTLWLVASLIALRGSNYQVVVTWLRTPFATLMMVLLVITLYHTALGLQVVVEDYVHTVAKLPALIVLRLACFALAAIGILAVLHIAFT